MLVLTKGPVVCWCVVILCHQSMRSRLATVNQRGEPPFDHTMNSRPATYFEIGPRICKRHYLNINEWVDVYK
jgi:hypothetical protein